MNDHIVKAARDEYETTHGDRWEDASSRNRFVYYSSAQRIIRSYLASLTSEVEIADLNAEDLSSVPK